MRDDFCDDVCLMMKEKKINRKKTHKEEREEISLSLLPCFIFYHPPLSSFF